jgi:fatty acid desaturase
VATVESGWISDVRSTLREAETDFFQHRSARYWIDFLMSAVLAFTAANIFLAWPILSLPQIIAFPLAIFWLYRLGSLVHEVAHLSQKEMRLYKVAWNLVAGVTMLTPSSFFTTHHRDHHSQRLYGTPQDPEYVVNVCPPGSLLGILLYLIMVLLFPLIVFLRFFLSPLTFLHPRLREWTLTRASSLTLNWKYVRRITPEDRRNITMVELLCWTRTCGMLGCVLIGFTPWTRLVLLYVLGASTFLFNQMRQLADHHFESDGERLDFDAHIRDSCNYSGRDFFTWLFFPFSIRYHALHHIFPSLPYHNLRAAHQHLLEHLPEDSPYRTLEQPGWLPVASKIFQRRQPQLQLEAKKAA